MFVSTWLYFVIIGYLILINYWGWLQASFLLLILVIIKYKKIPCLCLIIIFITWSTGIIRQSKPQPVFTVFQVKEHYSLARDALNRRIVVYRDDLRYGDKIMVESLQEVSGSRNPKVFNFVDYLKHNGIRYQGMSAERLTAGKGWGNQLYEYYLTLAQARVDYIRTYVYQQHNSALPEDLVFSCGLALRQLLNWLSGGIAFLIDRKYHKIVKAFLALLLYCLFPGLLALKIIMLFTLVKCLKKSVIERLWLMSLYLVLFDSHLLAHVAFIYLYLREFSRFINLSEDKLTQKFYLLFMQLLMFGKTNLLTLLFYRSYRFLLTITVLLGLLCGLVPLSWLAGWQLMLDKVAGFCQFFALNTFPSVFVLILFVFLISGKEQIARVLLPMILPLIQFQSFLNPLASVTVLDVGQGDCALISAPFNRFNMMIDAGNNYSGSTGKTIILPYLQARGLYRIDALMITHNDYDHSGSVSTIVENFYVDKLLCRAQEVTTEDFYLLIPDDIGRISDGERPATENADSLVALFSLNGVNYAFLADITKNEERKLLSSYKMEEFQILKLAHHGSDSAGSEELLSLANLEYGLISCGRNNRYGHPDKNVLARMQKTGLPYLVTAQDGYIEIIGWQGYNFLHTASGKFGIIKKVKR